MKNEKRPVRYSVRRTDHHWDKCWGVFDSLKNRFVMKDVFHRHCKAKAKELNDGEIEVPAVAMVYQESGVERLRRIVSAANMTMESSFDELTVAEVVNVIEACWASPWDILPDDLYEKERRFAARNGRLSAAALKRLEKDLG